MSGGKVPTGPGWWWLHEVTARFPPRPVCVVDRGGLKVRDGQGWYSESPIESVGTWGVSGGTNADHWLGPCLTPAEAADLTARAERAERERDEARRWAEAAAADENANAAELREVRAALDAIAALVGSGDVVERVRQIIAERDELASAFREHVEAVDNARYCYHDSTLWSDDGLDDRIGAAEQRLFAIERAHRVNP